MPSQNTTAAFSNPVYDSVRRRAGLFDKSAEGRLRVTGPDRAAWLQGLLTNDVALAGGQGCYAAYLTPQGRMITDVRVLELGDAMLLDVPGPLVESLLARLDLLIFTEEVQLQNVTGSIRRSALHGPAAARLLAEPAAIADEERLSALGEHESIAHAGAVGPIVVAASRALGMPGFDIYADAVDLARIDEALLAAGAVRGGDEVWAQLRVETGIPAFGADLDEHTLPLEAGIEDRAISLTKGCYVGQEVIIRVLHRGGGRVGRRLVGLLLAADSSGRSAAGHGDELVHGERAAGRITSLVMSPALNRPIALGYVYREAAEPGTVLAVRGADRETQAEVTTLPFVDHEQTW